MISIFENIIAAILYDAAKGIYPGFNDTLTRALHDTSVYFATRKENSVEFKTDKLEQILRGDVATEEIEKLKKGDGFIDKEKLAEHFAFWGDLYFEEKSKILPTAKEIIDYFLKRFEEYMLKDPQSASTLLRAYIEISRKQSSREREAILYTLFELKGLIEGIKRRAPERHEGLCLYTRLGCQGVSAGDITVNLVLGIRNNNSSFSAKYPEISIITPGDFPIDRWGLDGNGNDGLKRISRNKYGDTFEYKFKGGVNDIVHSKSELEVTCIRSQLQRVAGKFPSISIKYTIRAENFAPVSGEYTLSESELLQWKDKYYREEYHHPRFGRGGLKVDSVCANHKCSEYGIEVNNPTDFTCEECGQPFGWVCENCGRLNLNEFQNCPECNHKKPMPV